MLYWIRQTKLNPTDFEKEQKTMTFLGNLLWFFFGGLAGGLAWVLAGCLWCVTIVGIPIGKQCFKLARLALTPFGASVVQV